MAIIATISHVAMGNINSTVSTNSSLALESDSIEEERNLQKFLIFADGAECRCEASWENLYNPSSLATRERYYYNYETTKIRSNNLVTVENVYVLSADAWQCNPQAPRPIGSPRPQQRPMTTGQQQMRSPYNFNNRQLEMIGDVDFNNMDHQENHEEGTEDEALLIDGTLDEYGNQEENEQRDLQRYFSAGASQPRTYGTARNYGVRPYGATTYGYGKGMLQSSIKMSLTSCTTLIITHHLLLDLDLFFEIQERAKEKALRQ